MDHIDDRLGKGWLSWLAGEFAVAPFIGVLSLVAKFSGLTLLLFPEMGALSYDILNRPHGTWARSPVMLALTPFLAAILGTLITRELAYGPVAVLLAIVGAMAVIRLLRSPIAPALAAALLPVMLGETDWIYAPCVLLSTGALALIATLRRRIVPPPPAPTPLIERIDDELEEAPHDYAWVPGFFGFLAVVLVAAALTGWRFVRFPPLVVMAFEMFAHADVCPWALQPLRLPVACMLAVAGGLLAVKWLGIGALAAALAVGLGAAILRTMKLHVPPAIAVGLLPLIIHGAGWELSIAVGLGTGLLVASFLLWQRLMKRMRLHSSVA